MHEKGSPGCCLEVTEVTSYMKPQILSGKWPDEQSEGKDVLSRRNGTCKGPESGRGDMGSWEQRKWGVTPDV